MEVVVVVEMKKMEIEEKDEEGETGGEMKKG